MNSALLARVGIVLDGLFQKIFNRLHIVIGDPFYLLDPSCLFVAKLRPPARAGARGRPAQSA